jgi:glycosyltransferase involved in cell wall biosynthesis
VLEAMACGAAVVTTRDTVMAEVAGAAARLVPVGDASALATALLEALAHSTADREIEGARARSRAQGFTWDACVEQHLVAYDLALEG